MSPVSPTSISAPTIILLPDLVSYCKFDLNINRHNKLVSVESNQWFFNGDPDIDQATRRAFLGLKSGRFAAMCFPNVGYPQLRVCSDWLNWIFHLDNLSDDMDDRGIDKVANVVMNSFYHPHTYYSPARLNRMTKESVFLFSIIDSLNFSSYPKIQTSFLTFCTPIPVYTSGLSKRLPRVLVNGFWSRWISSSSRSS